MANEAYTHPSTAYRAENSSSGGVSCLDKIAREITARGNDMEVRTCREGLKIFEISKKVIAVIPAEKK